MQEEIRTNPLPPGYKLDEFIIDNVLSISDVSITYKATNEGMSYFIIKEYFPDSIAHRENLQNIVPNDESFSQIYSDGVKYFNDMGEALASINNKYISNAVKIIQNNNTSYIVFVCQEGISLKDILAKSNVLDYEDIQKIIYPILDGLDQLHSKNIYHLSINPDNILFRFDGTPVLIGFGSFYKPLMDKKPLIKKANKAFESIEKFQSNNDAIGPWTDIYSVGAVLYQCLTGNLPDESIKRYQAIQEIGVDSLNKLSEIVSIDIPLQTIKTIEKALSIHPNERLKSVKEWKQALMEIVVEENNLEKISDENVSQSTTEAKTALDADQTDRIDTQLKLINAYLGGTKQGYYVRRFFNQLENGVFPNITLNFGAAIFNVFWMCYRKMYLFFMIGFPILSIVLIYLIFYVVENHMHVDTYYFINPTIDLTALIYLACLVIFFWLFGNYVYYLHMRWKIYNAVRKYPDVKNQRKWLSRKGGISYISPILALGLMSSVVYFGYNHLYEQTQNANEQINQAITALENTSWEVSRFVKDNNRWPTKQDHIISQFYVRSYKYLEAIYISKQLIVVTFNNYGVLPNLANKSIALFGKKSEDNHIYWKCASINVPLEYLPVDCKIKLK